MAPRQSGASESVPAEEEETQVQEPVKPKAKGKSTGKAKGKGKAKAKVKGKGKGKAKAKAKAAADTAAAAAADDTAATPAAAPVAAPPRTGGAQTLKQKIMEELAKRSLPEVLEQARQEIKNCEAKIVAAQNAVTDSEIKTTEASMKEASKDVEDVVSRETLVLEKLRAAKTARGDVILEKVKAEQAKAEVLKSIKILELEIRNRDNVQALEDAKKAAVAAAEAARQAVEDAKLKEKEVAEQLKVAAAASRQEEDEEMRQYAEKEREAADARKLQVVSAKSAAKDVLSEIALLEKARQLRDKERRRIFAGLGKGTKGLKALTADGEDAAAGVKRAVLPTSQEASPAAKRQSVATPPKKVVKDID